MWSTGERYRSNFSYPCFGPVSGFFGVCGVPRVFSGGESEEFFTFSSSAASES
jgi:hypothetical protein